MMYQVVKMYGDLDPWWLLEGWQEDVVMCDTFDNYQDALAFYKREWQKLSKSLPKCEEKKDKTAFWDPEDQRWCDECDEYLQQYHSLLILEKGGEAELASCGNLLTESLPTGESGRPLKCSLMRQKNVKS